MLKVENARIRYNSDSASCDLIGWLECVLNDDTHKFYLNNIRIKAREVEGKWVVRLEFPSKTIVASDGTDKKVFFVKPVNSSAYQLVCTEVIRLIKENLKEVEGADKSL